MSESDDTDLLLLIPPDFFVIHSDSDDSSENYRKSTNDQCLKKLVNQVNELEERINFIESKDSLHSECSASQFIHPVDYPVTWDTSKLDSVHCRDLALRFCSLASAGFSLECDNNRSKMQCFEPFFMSSKTNVHYPNQSSSSISDVKSEYSSNCVSYQDYSSHLHASSGKPGQPAVPHNASDISIPCDIDKKFTVDEMQVSNEIVHHSQPRNIHFLNEIDKFLESKNRQTGKVDVLKTDERSGGVNYKDLSFPTTLHADKSLNESKQFVEGQLDQLTQKDLDAKSKNLYYNFNFDAEPCIGNSDEQLEKVEKLSQLFIDVPNRSEKTKGTQNETLFPEEINSKSSILLGHKGHANFNEENCENGFRDKYLSNVSQDRLSTFVPGPYTNNVWGRDTLRTSTSFNCDPKDIVHHALTENCVEGLPKNLVQDKNHNISRNDDQHLNHENSFSKCTINNKLKKPESYLEDKFDFPLSSNEIDETNDSISVGSCAQKRKDSRAYLTSDMQSGDHYDVMSNTNAGVTKSKNSEVSKFPNVKADANSKLLPFSLHFGSKIESLSTKSSNASKKEIADGTEDVFGTSIRPKTEDVQKGHFFINDKQSLIGAPTTHELARNSSLNQNERNQIFQKLQDSVGKIKPTADDGYHSSVGTASSGTNLFSLSEIWGKEVKELEKREILTTEQKLEEEHCRRKHCENIIQQLQCTVLEQQQKLAVAMRVDENKDQTIQKLQIAWRRLANHWQELEEQRHSISLKYSEEKEKHQQNITDLMLKTKQCELELSKALDLAQGYKEKSETLEQKMIEKETIYNEEQKKLQMTIQKGQNSLIETEKHLKNVQAEMKKMKEDLEAAEKKANYEKETAKKSQDDLKEMQQVLENLEASLSIVKEENVSLRLRFKEERARNDVLDQQMNNLKIGLDESKQKEKLLQSELKDCARVLEKTKVELRDYYQQQVELVVQEKLIEFQAQLDAAEVSLHQEMEQKEKLALETASKQIKHISEKNVLEVKLLEEKHKEELRLYKLQLTQATQQINELQVQLQSFSNRKLEIVEKLHSVMETQWQEALRIISGNSPIQCIPERQQVILQEKGVTDIIPHTEVKSSIGSICTSVPPLLVRHSSSSSTTDEIPFNKEDQLTFRASNEQHQTCNYGGDICPENADIVKKYIEMLLNRPPGCPLDKNTNEKNVMTEEYLLEERSMPKWDKATENQQIVPDNEKHVSCTSENSKYMYAFADSRPSKLSKPPWK